MYFILCKFSNRRRKNTASRSYDVTLMGNVGATILRNKYLTIIDSFRIKCIGYIGYGIQLTKKKWQCSSQDIIGLCNSNCFPKMC